MTGRRFAVTAQAKTLHDASGLPVIVMAAESDGAGGAFVAVQFGHVTVVEGEAMATDLVRALLANMAKDPHPCPDCDARLARLQDALAALSRDDVEEPTVTPLHQGTAH